MIANASYTEMASPPFRGLANRLPPEGGGGNAAGGCTPKKFLVFSVIRSYNMTSIFFICVRRERMTDKEQRAAAIKFAADWKDKGYEKG